VDEVLALYRRHGASDTSARVQSGENVRERVTAIGVVANYLPPDRRARTTRKALAYAAVFAGRTAWTMVRAREWSAAGHQLREAARSALLIPAGVRASGSVEQANP
jgi:hypothetical protein